MKTISVIPILITAVALAMDNPEPIDQPDNTVWANPKDINEESLKHGEELFRRNTNDTRKIAQAA